MFMDLYSGSETFPALFFYSFLITSCSNRSGHKSALQTCSSPGSQRMAEIQFQAHGPSFSKNPLLALQDHLPAASIMSITQKPPGKVQQLPSIHTSQSCFISNIPGYDLLPDCRKSWQAHGMSGFGNQHNRGIGNHHDGEKIQLNRQHGLGR